VLLLRSLALAQRFAPPPPLDDVGLEDVAGRGEQPRPFLHRERAEDAAVADDRLEHLDRRS